MNDQNRPLPANEPEPYTPLPPRRTKHPSERGKWIRLYFITLVVLFSGLTVGLIFWGERYGWQ
jgi:hypothetical protein